MSKVLVADSNKQNVEVLRNLLKASGYEVDSVCSIAEALAEARKDPPVLLVTDVVMSMIDEYALYRHHLGPCPVPARNKRRLGGVRCFVRKPGTKAHWDARISVEPHPRTSP